MVSVGEAMLDMRVWERPTPDETEDTWKLWAAVLDVAAETGEYGIGFDIRLGDSSW